MMTEKDILYEVGRFWVLDDRKHDAYVVMRNGDTYSTSDSGYPRTPDGLSIAKARVDYLARSK